MPISKDQINSENFLNLLTQENPPALPDGNDDLLSVLIRSILSQATNAANRNRAFSELLEIFEGDWNLVRLAEPIEIELAIKIGGLAKQKSIRIQKILNHVYEDFGECSLENLKEKTSKETWDYLCAFKGIGPQSAALSLMLSNNQDICPVNTDVLRVLKRVGFLQNESGLKAHHRVNSLFPEGRLKETHYAMIRHGKNTCHATPKCEECNVKHLCDYAHIILQL